MKNKASVFLKQIISCVVMDSIAKAKSVAAKAKSVAAKGKMSASKARLIMFTLMKSKKAVLLSSISNKIHGFLEDKEASHDDHEDDQSNAIIPFSYDGTSNYGDYYDEQDDKYPDLTHCLFDEEESTLRAEAEGGSVVEMVKNSKQEGEDFSLEDEIDHVADLFITKFYKQMRLQKLLSFKRHQQEMLEKNT